MKAFAIANLALAFLLELVALAAFAWWGFQATGNTLANIALGIGTPLLVAVFWGAFLAPTSKRRVTGITYIILQALVFALAALALVAVGQTTLAVVLLVVFVLNSVAVRLTGKYARFPQPGESRLNR